jgi:hypothetical protein
VAVISREHGYLFVHAPRTGGTALTPGVLLPLLGGRQLPRKPIQVPSPRGWRRIRQHITRTQLLEAGLLSVEAADRLLTFTTVRNPFDSLVSLYVKRRDVLTDERWATDTAHNRELLALAKRTSFPEYLDTLYGGAGRQRLFGPHLEGADVVLRFEHLQADFDCVLQRLGVPGRIEIPRHNVTTVRARDYRSYYSPEARAIVERVFAEDLERFGYEY